ncbi:MAG: FAD binding domain-containing protein [Pseudomonadota bacterium]
MKPARFDYVRATTVAEAVAELSQPDGVAKVLAGGQSLVPMLNLRLAPVSLLVDVADLPALTGDEDTGNGAIRYGACVTHADIEDGRVADPSHGLLPRIARDIAYRAIRTKGTIGGSIALADPSAEWPAAMMALNATFDVEGSVGSRAIVAGDMFHGAYTTALADDELLTGVRIPHLSREARSSFYKVCRKTGEFAASLAVVVTDRAHDRRAVVLGGVSGAPMRLKRVEDVLASSDSNGSAMADRVRGAAIADLAASGRDFANDDRRLHAATATRAVMRALES